MIDYMNTEIPLDSSPKIFRKTGRGTAVEAMGLRWLRKAKAVPIVKVISFSSTELVLEQLIPISPTPEAAHTFGVQLSQLHDAGAGSFGAPPQGWANPGFIGKAPLNFTHDNRWGRFFAEYRILPYTRTLTLPQRHIIQALCDRLINGDFDDGAPPARIHGDLWQGNVIFTANGATLIDPAAHGGHRISDLAMLKLFGMPYLEEIYRGYEENTNNLPSNWQDLIPLHQIHPLLVHQVLLGGNYGKQAVEIAENYL